MRRRFYNIVTVVLIVVIAFGGYMVISEYETQWREGAEYERLEQLVEDDSLIPSEVVSFERVYGALRAENGDFAGWISIEGTRINYPVMHTPFDSEFYLRRDFAKQGSRSGVPFIDGRCSLTDSENLIVYGHNMLNGSMFSDLTKYKEWDFFINHQIIELDTQLGRGRYLIAAVIKSTVQKQSELNQENVYNYVSVKSEADFKAFAAAVTDQSIYDTGHMPEYGDKLITLSTCGAPSSNERIIVIARMIEFKNWG